MQLLFIVFNLGTVVEKSKKFKVKSMFLSGYTCITDSEAV